MEVFEAHIKPDPCQTPFYQPFTDMPESIGTPEEIDHLQARAQAAIRDSVQPGMKRIKEYLESVYLHKTRKDIAVTSLPGGKEFYETCIRFHTSTSLSALEIHEIGKKEVDRLETQMKKVKQP